MVDVDGGPSIANPRVDPILCPFIAFANQTSRPGAADEREPTSESALAREGEEE